MRRFRSILFYTRGKKEELGALEKAVDLAQRNCARLTVVGVLRELPRDLRSLAAALPIDALQEEGVNELGEQLNAFVAPVRREGLDLAVKPLCGTPFVEIIREALRCQHDLVMMAAEGGLRNAFLGGTSMRLMRKCPCPVWVIKPGQRVRFAQVMAAVDPVPDDPVRRSVNMTVMNLATSLTRSEGGELHIVHACDTQSIDLLCAPWGAMLMSKDGQAMMAGEKEERESLLESRHRQWVDELLAGFDLSGIKHEIHISRDAPTHLIPKLAAAHEIDLIVMGTLARAGIAGFLMGNTSEEVLQQVNCSVLTVKPEGFVTPVTIGKT